MRIKYKASRARVVVASLTIVAILSCTREKRPYNLVLITVDTLVPAHLGYNGYERETSPNIDALAEKSIVFDRCYSVSGWTLPSIATILTGLYPSEHGATDLHWSMDEQAETLASLLRSRGYETRGYVSHVMLKPQYGIAKGFKSFDYSVLNLGHPHDVSTAEQLTDLVLEDLRKVEEPFFIWVHYFDPHFLYLRHERWAYFGERDVDRYDQEIAFTDHHLGRALSYLQRKRYWDRTLVVFTADHGEEFGEHGGSFHYTLYDEVLRVPLLVRAPLAPPRRVDEPVRQVDLLPTVLSLLEVPFDHSLYPGRNVLDEATDPEPIFFERDRPPPYAQRGILVGSKKLFTITKVDTSTIPPESRGTYIPVTNVRPGTYMFDLLADPAEMENIYSKTDPGAEKLLDLLSQHFAGKKRRTREITLDRELREKLRSLGYIR